MTNILDDANVLRNNINRQQTIAYQIEEILKSIRDEIANAHAVGMRHIVYKLPIMFTVPHMTNADAQRVIWGNILAALIKKNYRVTITHDKEQCSLYITWMSREDENELRHFNQLIISHSGAAAQK